MVLIIVFPSLIVLTSVLAITLFHRVKHQLPKSANEELYLTYLLEAQGSERREILWAKCLVEANGDEMKAKSNYVKARIKEGDKSFISQGTAHSDHVKIDDDSLNLKVYKKRIFILLALIIVVTIFFVTRTNLTFLGPHTSSSKDHSTVVGIYELQDCQQCLAGSCKAEGPNKIIIDFSQAVGFTEGNFISDKGELFSEIRSTDWRGCKFDRDSVFSIAKCKENYETDFDIFQTYRFLSPNLYTFEKSTTSKVSNGITFETLTCKVKPISFP
jgi:hypothetical protein